MVSIYHKVYMSNRKTRTESQCPPQGTSVQVMGHSAATKDGVLGGLTRREGKDSLEKEMATHSSILVGNPMDRGAWRATVPRVARVGQDTVTKQQQQL